MEERRNYVDWELITNFVIDAFVGYGIPREDAEICADVLFMGLQIKPEAASPSHLAFTLQPGIHLCKKPSAAIQTCTAGSTAVCQQLRQLLPAHSHAAVPYTDAHTGLTVFHKQRHNAAETGDIDGI